VTAVISSRSRRWPGSRRAPAIRPARARWSRASACALVTKKRGTGSNPHHHPNEQWNYIVKGKLRVKVGDEPEQVCGPGTLLYFPANIVHYTIATQDEDVVFFAVKDMTHGIIGIPVDAKKGAFTGAKK
jgi:oxalate decarboxylase/phosphoglucose isomerase-like protein (cupin superfamily)